MSKPKKADRPEVTDEDFGKLKEYRPEALHFAMTAEDGPHTIERGAPAHGGGLTVDGHKAESLRHAEKGTLVVKWSGGGYTEFVGVDETTVKDFPAN